MKITPKQLGRLQTLFSQMARREIGMDASREGRLMWATERLGKKITSFKDLTAQDAGFLIDGIQGQLGLKVPASRPAPAPRPRLDRDQARRAGLDGRHDGKEFAGLPQMAPAADIERIQDMLDQLGWSQETFFTFLNSQRSPLAGRSDKAIRTTSDANKVWWALKRIAQSKGIWARDRRKPA